METPIDLLSGFPGWHTEFLLQGRQEVSRHASGRIRVKEFGVPLWSATYLTRSMPASEFDMWSARLTRAMHKQTVFWGKPFSRNRPIKHAGKSILPEGVVSFINDDRDAIRVSGLVGVTLSAGDMIGILGEVYQVHTYASGDPTNIISIFPNLKQGVQVGAEVKVTNTSCPMTIIPNSLSATTDISNGRGTIRFSCIEVVQ